MHTVELLELALVLAERWGFSICQEWLGGSGGGSCEIKGRKWIFLDLALSPADQLEQVATALRGDVAFTFAPVPWELQGVLGMRKSA